jgi:hypothetical protein
MRGSPQADISLPISPLFLLVLQEIPIKCHILAHFRPISEYFDLLRLLEKCGEAPHPAKTIGLHKHRTERQKRQKEEADCGKAAGKEAQKKKKGGKQHNQQT